MPSLIANKHNTFNYILTYYLVDCFELTGCVAMNLKNSTSLSEPQRAMLLEDSVTHVLINLLTASLASLKQTNIKHINQDNILVCLFKWLEYLFSQDKNHLANIDEKG